MIRIALAIICAVVGCLLIARSFRALTRCARVVERSASRLARKRWLAILSVGLVSFGVNVALSRVSGVPNPVVHDEFSYLLAADTFAHGRLSNPTHRLWPHFETMHVLQRPTYSSKYPPGQGLLLAVGKRFGGGPIVGAWLGSALACAATCWMLMASVRPRWAFVGGLVATSNPYVVQWGQSYWGGSLGMLGGSLLLGGVFRSFRRTLWSDGLAIGLGLAILAVSRPYEGLALAMASLLGLAFRRSRVGGLRSLSETARLLPPILVPLLLAAGLILVQNRSVTGRLARLPYLQYERSYSNVPVLLIQGPTPDPVKPGNATMRGFYEGWVSEGYEYYRQMGFPCMMAYSFLRAAALQLPLADTLSYSPASGVHLKDWFLGGNNRIMFLFFPIILIQVPLFLKPWLCCSRAVRGAAFILAAFTAALSLETWKLPHYAAPAYGLVLVLSIRSLREWRRWRPLHRTVGRAVQRGLLLLALVWPWPVFLGGRLLDPTRFGANRSRVVESLKAKGGRHVVIVKYGPLHNSHQEWVYNEADIDGAPIVWARDLGPDRNRELVAYFCERQVWLLEPDPPVPRMVAYPQSGADEVVRDSH